MDDKTLVALTELANKLGTTAEYLFGVLVKQAPISGTINLLIILAWIGFTVLWLCIVIKKTRKPKATMEDLYPRAAWSDEQAFAGWLSAITLSIIAAVAVSSSLVMIVTAFLNPEYWALAQILK